MMRLTPPVLYSSQTHNLSLIVKKKIYIYIYQTNTKRGTFYNQYLTMFLKTVIIIPNRESLRKCHSQE